MTEELFHDACGIAFLADINNKPSNRLFNLALEALRNMEHRGATGAEENTGDGAGILMSIPYKFLKHKYRNLPPEGEFLIGNLFIKKSEPWPNLTELERIAESEGLEILGFERLDTDNSMLGATSKNAEPNVFQVILTAMPQSVVNLEIAGFRYLKKVRNTLGYYFCSLSTKKIVYKGMLTTAQLSEYYLDLQSELIETKLNLVHSRFSTNTIPSWDLAQPFSYIAHNGEINTIRGNRNWFKARESLLESEAIGSFEELTPILTPGASDSSSFNECLELLHLSGRSLDHSALMMIPPAYEKSTSMDEDLKAFYEFNSTIIEPWDGPASLTFTDGDIVGSILDRDGFRPGRYSIYNDGLVIMASETGVLGDLLDEGKIIKKGRLNPGEMFLIDTKNNKVVTDQEIKDKLKHLHPYKDWLKDSYINLTDLPKRENIVFPASILAKTQKLFGLTQDKIDKIIKPMVNTGSEPIGSMGNDTPLAFLSKKDRSFFDNFTTRFAQVTNPPLDWEREINVTSLTSSLGPEPNLLKDTDTHAKKIVIDIPALKNIELAKIERIGNSSNTHLKAKTIDCTYPVATGSKGLEQRLSEIEIEAKTAIETGTNILVLSDRHYSSERIPIPSLLFTATVHNSLIQNGLRTKASLIVEAGDVYETHHLSLLISVGAGAVNPYLGIETIRGLIYPDGVYTDSDRDEVKNYLKALSNGVMKTMSKMGVCTIMSFRGAMLFDTIGVSDELLNRYFGIENSNSAVIPDAPSVIPDASSVIPAQAGISSRVIDLDTIHKTQLNRYYKAYPKVNWNQYKTLTKTSGEYSYNQFGEFHSLNPTTISLLQTAVKNNDYETYKKFAHYLNTPETNSTTIRSQLKFAPVVSEKSDAHSVIPAQAGISSNATGENSPSVRKGGTAGGGVVSDGLTDNSVINRISTGAMSFGSLSETVHKDIARAMNRVGSRSNSGEGGEEHSRLTDGEIVSKIKQVASGRFGVNIDYLSSAKVIQIKLAQGAKPGEGGHLPGVKVFPLVAEVRSSTPGVGLISPPPHHDIYSIEDLKQLVFDLKMSNPDALISVKLASEKGVGLVASGVAKCKADLITISGFDGGTGASPLSSIKHTGKPFETGIFETHQVLLENGLRENVKLCVDGGIRTGRDIVIGAILGADEFSIATTALITLGCVMYRKCNSNKCPVGIATQNKDLEKLYKGNPDFLVNYLQFLQLEVNEILHSLGFEKLSQIIGRTDLLENDEFYNEIFSNSLPATDSVTSGAGKDQGTDYNFDSIKPIPGEQLSKQLNEQIVESYFSSLRAQRGNLNEEFTFSGAIRNTDLAVGTMLSGVISKNKLGMIGENSPLETKGGTACGGVVKKATLQFTGSAGQSLGAFLNENITIRVEGETNDYCGKGLCGGKIVVTPFSNLPKEFNPSENIISGNVIGYGATAGTAYFKGRVGERFGVRNSGATLVCLGAGDHALEYMSGGIAIILGKVGQNPFAGFLGGRAYLLDFDAPVSDDLVVRKFDSIPVERQNKINNILQDFYSETSSSFQTRSGISEGEAVSSVIPAQAGIQTQGAIDTSQLVEVTPLRYEFIEQALEKLGGDTSSLADNWDKFNKSIDEQVNAFKKVSSVKSISSEVLMDCLDCGVSFCNSGCPLGNNIPLINKLVAEGKLEEAAAVLGETNNFPEITSRVCPALCECACVRGINLEPVSIKENEKIVSDHSTKFLFPELTKSIVPEMPPMPADASSGKTVAIIGSGPAGLAAAQQLARASHTVRVYESAEYPGGILRYGIPEAKLPKQLIDARLNQMEIEGVRFECNTTVGKDIGLTDLKASYDAVLIAIGSRVPRITPVLENAPIIPALDFLTDHINANQYSHKRQFDVSGKRVLIIGQGDSGNDCLRASLDMDAEFVTALQIMPKPNGERTPAQPWPNWYNRNVLTELEEKAIANGKYEVKYESTVTSVSETTPSAEAATPSLPKGNVQVGISQVKGFDPVPGTEVLENFDIIIVSIGFANPDTTDLLQGTDIKLDARGNISRDTDYQTAETGIFVCSDAATGQGLVVKSIREGRDAAQFINNFLQ